jgi:hypothetical protein
LAALAGSFFRLAVKRFIINPKPKTHAMIATATSNVVDNGLLSVGGDGLGEVKGDAHSGSSTVTLSMSKGSISGKGSSLWVLGA